MVTNRYKLSQNQQNVHMPVHTLMPTIANNVGVIIMRCSVTSIVLVSVITCQTLSTNDIAEQTVGIEMDEQNINLVFDSTGFSCGLFSQGLVVVEIKPPVNSNYLSHSQWISENHGND